ncbi:sialic acid-binding Ig-like lectin 13 isoform X2 [Trichosurus vulpecula]|uniref:sialic acid-binding Ig-like lectin 13 isoform X2 n=1 Tax=Trichosurus vulpecula TaxID=9337 RepID=UPI00186ADA53|nr:sialic acid-binding Ig-like lectin 13 isoform X2 [Trichosurus vulpecula]
MLLLLLLLLLSLGGSQSQKEGYALVVSPPEMVQEGLCVYIPCAFFYPGSWVSSATINGYWYRRRPMVDESVLVATNDQSRKVDEEAIGRFHLVGDLMKKKCSLSIMDIQKKDSGEYFFRMERGWTEKFSYLNYQVNLDVRALTQKPDIFIPGILEPGRSVTLMCAAPWVCGEGTPPTFSWSGAALSNLEPSQGTRYFSEMTFTPKPQDHGTSLTCRMTFPGAGVSTETTIQLNVAYPLRNFGISVDGDNRTGLESSSNLSVLKDESLRLLCQADSNPPAILSWAHRGRVVLSSWPSDPGILVLPLPRLGVKDGGEYSCQAQHRLETKRASMNLSVLYAPENLKVSALGPNRTAAILGNVLSLVVLVGESLQLECVADSSPPAYMNWVKGSQPLNASFLSSPGILGLELSHVQPEDGGEYTCQAQNPWGTRHISLNLSVQDRTNAAAVEFSKGALLGAGIMALLIFCLVFAYKKFPRKEQLETGELGTTDSQSSMEVDYVNLEMNQGGVPRPPPPEPVTQAPPNELHYASLNFRRPNPKSQGIDTEYSEIKF